MLEAAVLGVPQLGGGSQLPTCASNPEGVTEAGAEISGTDMIYNYEQILRQITYNNMKPAYYLNRQFRLSCSLRDQRFISNEFIETVRILWRPAASRLSGDFVRTKEL